MIGSPMELAHRQRRFWFFLAMRLRGRNDTIYRNYDLLAKWDGSGESDFKWAGFRGIGEPLKHALKRLNHNIWLKHDKRFTDVALIQLMREYVVWQRIHDGGLSHWPTRHKDDNKRLHEENERAKREQSLHHG